MARVHIPDPRGGRRASGFALTPLADVMTQLLIFFMLTSNLTPFSMLTVQTGVDTPPPEEEQGPLSVPDQTPAAAVAAQPQAALWTVEVGAVVVAGQRFDFALLPPLAEALRAQGETQVVLTIQPDARIQDIVAVLEALNAVEIAAVQIARGAT